ncbi:MAG: hypothetical protein MK193_03110 [Lentisphaeria bacterium]|nr:hypothetical protein [Lentisphaeria bacterium]
MYEQEYLSTMPADHGVHILPNNHIAVCYRASESSTFEEAANGIIQVLAQAEGEFPGLAREMYLLIDGHDGQHYGFDDDFFELQNDFLIGTLGRFFTALHLPGCGTLTSSEAQQNDVPQFIQIEDTQGTVSPCTAAGQEPPKERNEAGSCGCDPKDTSSGYCSIQAPAKAPDSSCGSGCG